jgi:hypothetical protein
VNIKVLIPVVILVVIYVAFFVYDILTRSHTKYLPKWLWMIICFISIPLGGIIYYFVGHVPNTELEDNPDD